MALAFSGGSLSRRLLREPAQPSARPRVAPGDMGTLEVASEPNLPLHRTRPTILTAMFGGSDVIRPQVVQDIEVDWICVTDDPELNVPAPYRRVVIQPGTVIDHSQVTWVDATLSAKRYKLMPWTVTDSDRVLWIDANMEVTSPSFAREALACVHDGIAAVPSPPADVHLRRGRGTPKLRPKYRRLPIREQVAQYRAAGHPDQGGLYASGVIAWDVIDPRAQALGEEWMTEVERWTVRDQLSLPVVVRRLGIEPGTFPGALREPQYSAPGYSGNRWLRIWPHLPSGVSPATSLRRQTRSMGDGTARLGLAAHQQRPLRDPQWSKPPMGGLSPPRWAATTSRRECPYGTRRAVPETTRNMSRRTTAPHSHALGHARLRHTQMGAGQDRHHVVPPSCRRGCAAAAERCSPTADR